MDDNTYLTKAETLVRCFMETFEVKDPNLPVSARMVCMLVAELAVSQAAHINELEARLDGIESHGIKYFGSHQRALSYRKGSVVTYQGNMWTALADVPEGVVPGNNPAMWQLSAKGGKAAKGSRQ